MRNVSKGVPGTTWHLPEIDKLWLDMIYNILLGQVKQDKITEN